MSNNKPNNAALLLALLLALAIACTTASSIRPSGARKQHGPRRLLLGGQKYFLALNETSGILLKPAKHQHRELGASTPTAAVVVKMQGAAVGPAPSRDAALSLKVSSNSSQQPLVVLELGRGGNSAGGPAAAAAGSNQDLQQSAKQQLGGPGSAASASSSNSSTETDAAGAAASDAAAAVAAAPSPNNPALLASRQRSQAMFTSGPGGFWYAPQTNSSSVPLGMPVSESGLPLTRWVMCAWGVSNFSSPLMLTSDAMVQAQTLINNFTSMAPGQVQLAAMANVTLSLSLSELPASTEAQLTPSLIAAASQWAGGFDPAYIVISYTQPDYGVPTPQFQAAGAERVTTRDQDTLLLPNTTSNSSSNSSSSSGRRLLLRGGVGAGRALAAAVGGSGEVPPNVRAVWVAYTRMAPLNVTALQRRVAATCGVDSLTTGLMLDGTACAELLNAALVANGVPAQEGQPALEVSDEPMVSLAIRLAIGVTEAQAGAGTDTMLANWLAVPRNIRSAIAVSGVPDPIGPNALIRWLLPPEIWVSPPPPTPNPLSKPANAVGLALGVAAAVVLLAALLGFLLFRRRRAQRAAAAAAGDKYEAGSTASSRRRRRRHGKRRYLMPEAPPPLDPNAPCSSAAAAAAATAAAAAAAAGRSSSDGGVGAGSSDSGDDVAMSPDQIRPAMRELGDSVTSAVRFEDEDEETGEQPDGEGSNLNSNLDAAAAAAAAGGSGGAARSGSGPVSLGQRVLAAREALLAERQGSAGPAAAAGGSGGGGAVSLSRLSSGGSNVGGGNSSSSSHTRPAAGGWVEMGAMAAAGAGGATAAAAAAAAGAAQYQQPQQPRPWRLLSPFGTTQAQQLQQQQQQSPAQSLEQQGIAPVAGRAHSSPRSFELLPQQQQQKQKQHMPGLVSHAPSVAAATAAAATQQQQQQQQQQPELPSLSNSTAAAGSAPGVPFKPRSLSPFAVAYDFTQLAGALPTQHSSSSCNSSSRANSGAGSATLQGPGRRSSSNEGALLPQHPQPTAAAGRLQGVGSRTVAVAPDGSFTLTD